MEKNIKMKFLFLDNNFIDYLTSSFYVSAVKLGGISGLFFQNKITKTNEAH